MSELSSAQGNWNLSSQMCDDIKEKLMDLSVDANGSLKAMLNDIGGKIDADQAKQQSKK